MADDGDGAFGDDYGGSPTMVFGKDLSAVNA
jgi:hypothetical protein